MNEENKTYTIVVNGSRIEVTRQIYKAYYQEYEKERYQIKKEIEHHVLSLDKFCEDGIAVENEMFEHVCAIDEQYIQKVQMEQLYDCLAMLEDAEQEIIYALFFNGISERQLAKRYGVYQYAIHTKKKKILAKLKKLLESL